MAGTELSGQEPDRAADSPIDAMIVYTTTSDQEEARELAGLLVARRLAACAQISGPIESTYWWQGEVESAEEWRLALKTRRSRFDEVAAAIRESHSYDMPQIVGVPIVAADPAYLRWLHGEVPKHG